MSSSEKKERVNDSKKEKICRNVCFFTRVTTEL
jgi:hypothetical protein